MGIALAVVAAWLALAIAWARLRRAGVGPSERAEELVTAMRRAPLDERARLAGEAPEGTWERSLGLDVQAASTPDDRAEAIDESLAQLHSPLVERVAVPDRALGEDAVLVERNQPAQRRRGQRLEQ